MEYLLFKVINNDIQYAIVSPKMIYLINEKEYALLKDSGDYQILNEFKHIAKEKISKFTTSKGKTVVTIFDHNNIELYRLNFSSIALRKKFTGAFPDFRREIVDSKNRINPIIALALMLITYSFIWAGTRPNPADINPEGIRWKPAYWNVRFLEWLNSQIGQKLILAIGLILLLSLLYLIFRPELWNSFSRQQVYSNPIIKGTTDNIS